MCADISLVRTNKPQHPGVRGAIATQPVVLSQRGRGEAGRRVPEDAALHVDLTFLFTTLQNF